jgi:hypothetical protein
MTQSIYRRNNEHNIGSACLVGLCLVHMRCRAQQQDLVVLLFEAFPRYHRIIPSRARIFKLLRAPGIDSKESIPPIYVAWRAGTITLFQIGS